MYRVTTWGKWEEERKALTASILADEKIQTEKEKLDKALFEEVNTAMVKATSAYIKEHAEEFKQQPLPPELLINSYQVAVNAVLASLSSALDIKEELLNPHFDEFQAKAMATVNEILTHLSTIGNLAQHTKIEAINDLYGPDFEKKYPGLFKLLPYEDPELIELAKSKINTQSQEINFGPHKKIIDEQLIYINQLAPQLSTSSNFEEQFKLETKKTLEQFKHDIANPKKANSSAVTPFWKDAKFEGEIKTSKHVKGYEEDKGLNEDAKSGLSM